MVTEEFGAGRGSRAQPTMAELQVMSGYRGLGSWVASALCASVLLFNATARADEPISEDAKLYFKNGVELIQSQPPNYHDAYYQFKLAYEKSHSWKVLGNFGLCA